MTAVIQEVAFNDTEGLDTGDLNQIQRSLKTLVQDLFLGGLARLFAGVEARTQTSVLFGIGAGGRPSTNASGLQSVGRSGVIVQPTASGSLNVQWPDAGLLAYYLSSGEFVQTHPTADGTNPRIDLVQIKIDVVTDNAISRDMEDANALQSGAAVEETVTVTGGAGVLSMLAVSILGVSVTTGGKTGAFTEGSATVPPTSGVVQVALDRKTLTFNASDAVTQVKVTYIPAINIGHVKSSQSFNKIRHTRATVSVKAGTPAVNPVMPAPDFGYVPWYAVVVPAAFAGPFVDNIHIMDLRVPFGGGYHEILKVGSAFDWKGSGWTLGGDSTSMQSAALNDQIAFLCPFSQRDGRLVRLTVAGKITGSIKLQRRWYDTGSNLTADGNIDQSPGPGLGVVDFGKLNGTATGANATTLTPLPTGAGAVGSGTGIQVYEFALPGGNFASALWCNAQRLGADPAVRDLPGSVLELLITAGAASDRLHAVKWEIVC